MPNNTAENQEFTELLKNVHAIGKETIARYAAEVDEDARFPHESFEAIKSLKLMSAYVPTKFGGMGLNVEQISIICEALGHYCGSTAMIYAMHKIQVACIVHHCMEVDFFKTYVDKLVSEQRLIASATTEIGTGGDLLSSFCAVEENNGEFEITKKAPVISYGEAADDLMLTARRNMDAPKSDQVGILLSKDQYTLEAISGWDTLGFRGTCSAGFVVTAKGAMEQVNPVPFTDILSQTMHPYAHITWASLWSGICADAVNNARIFVKNAMRKNPNMPPISSIRLGELDCVLSSMRNNITVAIEHYSGMLETADADAFTNFGFSIRINNLKINSSQFFIDIVGKAMLICGISSYRNDSDLSLCRHIRDAYGASLMVNNDRIMMHNATLLLMHKEEH